MLYNTLIGQTACNGILPFEEDNGIVTIEMESGLLVDDWKTGTSASGYTGDGYIYWDGTQSFGALSGSPITYNIKINTIGTYKFSWRTIIGLQASTKPSTEHNDAWVKIEADDFYGEKNGGSIVRPRPQCESDASSDCPEGRSVGGFFKVYGNNLDYKWVGFTSDNDPHEIFATFNNPGTYKIIVDARSSYLFIDRMVLRLTSVSDADALDLNNPQSSCSSITLSTNNQNSKKESIDIYPIPASDRLFINNLPQKGGIFSIYNVAGAMIKKVKLNASNVELNISELTSGLYFLSYKNGSDFITTKFIKN